ncbi:hypothetical protein KGM_201009 [Danaus plexippus plexippus]|uniref:Uncharacterized protein n=1 Tax=Danaus plexippus plexippus TaxID=278856 RepID=A0A212EQ92_DANPL|nr:hypothetical protein KGM_201009 [Danaus plexippus plexippus]
MQRKRLPEVQNTSRVLGPVVSGRDPHIYTPRGYVNTHRTLTARHYASPAAPSRPALTQHSDTHRRPGPASAVPRGRMKAFNNKKIKRGMCDAFRRAKREAG